jgi:CPA2 family monovalent cation:H+ antiporter-2
MGLYVRRQELRRNATRETPYDLPVDDTAPAILEIGLVLLGAVASGRLARRLGLPAVVGYLALGLAVSPFTPGYIADRERLQLLADLGVVLLLFEVGIEVDPGRLRHEQRGLLLAVPLQMLLSTALAAVALIALGVEQLTATVLGLCVAFSSSVVIVNMTRSVRRTTDPQTDEALLGWAVLQDVTGVVMASILLASVGSSGRGFLVTTLGLAGFAAVALATARILPRALRAVATQPDFFLIVSVASGFTLAGAGAVVFGLPLGLAAFVGGLAVTESPESAEARQRLLPFRDLLAVLFFVAIGSLIDPAALSRGLGWLALLVVLIVAAKILLAYVLARLCRVKARSWQLAIGLGQIGEFSFVLASALVAAHSLSAEIYSALLTAAALTIGASSVAVRLAGRHRIPSGAPAQRRPGSALDRGEPVARGQAGRRESKTQPGR